MVGEIRRLRAELHAGNGARYSAGFLVTRLLAGRIQNLSGAIALQVNERRFAESRDGNTVAVLTVVLNFHFGSGGKRGGAGCVIHHFAHLLQINGIGVADIEIGDSAVGHHVGRCAALHDNALHARFGPHAGAHRVDVIEQMNDRFERIAAGPRSHLVGGRAGERVLHAIDVETAGSEARRRP